MTQKAASRKPWGQPTAEGDAARHPNKHFLGDPPSAPGRTTAPDGIPGKVIVIEPTGAETELLVDVGGQSITLVMHGRTSARPDDTVHLVVDTDKAHVFDSGSGQRL